NNVDQNSLMQRLTALANRLDDLPMIANEAIEDTVMESGEVSDSIEDWQKNIEKSASSFLDHFIRVSDRNKADEKAFVAPNQEVYLRENIRLRLQIAILAIPRQQNELYKQSLDAVGTWIRSYFETQNESVKSFLKELDDLSEQSIYID
ncbi:HemX protein, partial [Escherichia coli]|nr:HemX protein [Escherichia coli]